MSEHATPIINEASSVRDEYERFFGESSGYSSNACDDVDSFPSNIDFIETYAQYADVLEAPREMHEWVARQVIAAILNRNGVIIPHGALTYSLDLWVLLLSGSGYGRSTLVGLSRPILEKANLTAIERDAHWGSPQSLYQEAAEGHAALWTWGEMAERLKLLNQAQFAGAKEWITDRYDNFKVPSPVTYRRTGKETDTPSIKFSVAPRINILATSSEAWFFQNLAREDSTGGFIARWILIKVRSTGKVIPTPKGTDPVLAKQLAIRLRQIAELRNKADLSEILGEYDKWYRLAKERFEAQPNAELACAFFNRFRVHILKLAVINEVSSATSLKVSRASWERAVKTAEQLEETIFRLLATGMDKSGYDLSKMVEKVANSVVQGLSLKDFTRAFQHMPERERKEKVITLLQTGTIVAFSHHTTGRTATIFVHSDSVPEFKKSNPKDMVITSWGRA